MRPTAVLMDRLVVLYRHKKTRALMEKAKSLRYFFVLLRTSAYVGSIAILMSIVEYNFAKHYTIFLLATTLLLTVITLSCGVRVFCHHITTAHSITREKTQYERRERRIKKDADMMKPVRVVLICDYPAYWSTVKELYYLLVADSRFQVTILAIPDISNFKVDNYDILKYFSSNSIEYIKAKRTFRYYRIGKLKAHYIITCRPFDSCRPLRYSNDNLKKHARLCNIMYATVLARGHLLNIDYNFYHLGKYDILFAETPESARLYKLKQKEQPQTQTRIIMVGSSKFDAIFYSDYHQSSSTSTQSVLYTPRWNIWDGTSSFMQLKDLFLQFAKSNPSVEFVFRPHPLMERTFQQTQSHRIAWVTFIRQIEEHGNVFIDVESDYHNAFKRATVLLSDLSSLLAEFLLTGKPVIYIKKKHILNSLGESISRGFYCCSNEDETLNTLSSILTGYDPKKELRDSIISDSFFFGSQNAAQNIRDRIIADYSGNYLVS